MNKIKLLDSSGLVAVFVLISTLLCFVSDSQAQTQGSNRAARIVPIIVQLLLDEPDRTPEPRPAASNTVTLDLNEQVNPRIDIDGNDALLIEFELQEEDVELCFDLFGPAVNQGALQLELNGEPLTASFGSDNCFVITQNQQRTTNFLLLRTTDTLTARVRRIELTLSRPLDALGFPTVTRGQWDERAVRKVLKVFAYGGHASGQQIRDWANLRPQNAINQMLNFELVNERLSPLVAGETYSELATTGGALGTLAGFADFLASDASNLPFPVAGRIRENFAPVPTRQLFPERFNSVFAKMATVRGLNPFRQKIGLWETNYHLAVNAEAGVGQTQIVAYYDAIMNEHQKTGVPYHQVMGVAAKSAAVATQYGHRSNQWIESQGECRCNDDFAREIHQLFYGIFGDTDPNHEEGTIRQTSRMLTDMPVPRVSFDSPRAGRRFDVLGNTVDFGQRFHHQGDLTILGHTISGNTASQKIDNLMPISMQHPESLENLPIMIVQVLADDNLSSGDSAILRRVWRDMGVDRNFLRFIRGYALSRLFHDPTQYKYATSLERGLYLANRFNTSNIEAFYGGTRFFNADNNGNRPTDVADIGVDVQGILSGDNAGNVFEPINNVFGAQSALEASDSALSFSQNYNYSATDSIATYLDNFATRCPSCDGGNDWLKSWNGVIPANNQGAYPADHVARWLWEYIVGNTDQYSSVEEAHLVSLLGAVSPVNFDAGGANPSNTNFHTSLVWDLNHLLCVRADRLDRGETAVALSDLVANVNRYCRASNSGEYNSVEQAALDIPITQQTLTNQAFVQAIVNELKQVNVPIDSTDTVEARRAADRVNAAVAFIFATPFVFATGE